MARRRSPERFTPKEFALSAIARPYRRRSCPGMTRAKARQGASVAWFCGKPVRSF